MFFKPVICVKNDGPSGDGGRMQKDVNQVGNVFKEEFGGMYNVSAPIRYQKIGMELN